MKHFTLWASALTFAAFTATSVPTSAHAFILADVPEYTITIKDHRFTPEELKIPAKTKIRLVIRNEDPTPEEFESYDFNREKIVSGNSEIKIFVGPLKPGTYKFFGEFNIDTAQGRLIVE